MASAAAPSEPQDRKAGQPGPSPQFRPDGRLRRHAGAFLDAVRRAPNSRRIYLVVAAVGVAVGGFTFGQLRLNAWQRDFYDALAGRDLDGFLVQLLVFAAIVALLLSFGVAQTWLRETLKIQLREALSSDLLREWLVPRRAYQLSWAGEIGANPDQRIHEDSRHLCELCADLGVGLLQASLLLVSFVGVLWVLSEHVVLELDGGRLHVPGYLVWCALAYALAGSWLSWRVGRPLVALNAERYAREGDFRFALVHTNEAAESIGLYSGEQDARRGLAAALERVLAVSRRLARGLANLTWVTAGYGWVALVVPIVAAAPGYFNGTLTFGELMMVAGAFLQVQQSLRWYVDNFSNIADWRASLLRVMTLRLALPELERMASGSGRIGLARHPAGTLALRGLVVALPGKRVSLPDGNLELGPGERLLITGGPGSGKSMLFRAIAGLWPWGSGTVLLPPAGQLLFLPQRPYLPLGSLRQAVAYPAAAEAFPDAAVRTALQRVGLGHLAPQLDEQRRWDRELGVDEQQSLAFARLLLHRPKWVVMDDPLNALDDARRAALCGLFEDELKEAAVLGIGRSQASAPFFTRIARLVEQPDALSLQLPQPYGARP
jgi:putative ATP-binding cassette transporter